MLTILEMGGSSHKGRLWTCKCDCGNTTSVLATVLNRERIRSCGCMMRVPAVPKERRNRPLYQRWLAMRARCNKPGDPAYSRYGGRGIAVCDQWADYATFEQWAMTSGFRPELQIDRIDNDGPYSPDNCRWATPTENSRNKRSNRWIDLHGKRVTVAEAAAASGLGWKTLACRLDAGYSPEVAVMPGRRRVHERQGAVDPNE